MRCFQLVNGGRKGKINSALIRQVLIEDCKQQIYNFSRSVYLIVSNVRSHEFLSRLNVSKYSTSKLNF